MNELQYIKASVGSFDNEFSPACRLCKRLEKWRQLSMQHNACGAGFESAEENASSSREVSTGDQLPGFPLIPASKGFCISLEKALKNFKEALVKAGIELE